MLLYSIWTKSEDTVYKHFETAFTSKEELIIPFNFVQDYF
jgi:hypothetical protein